MITARELMASFADRTGITGSRPQRRYLWTDAFAVCNFLGLGERELALATIQHVHHELGRHRADDARRGWISGLSEADGEAHPTLGGLRIGKSLPERSPSQALDERLEWDRDGQYFHYLTKWMHALDQTARTTGDDRYATWARELADTAHLRFVHGPRAARRMFWKMSIDLMRPLVASMGHHDPLDGYVTGVQLRATLAAIAEYRAMIDPSALATSDPLGIGGLLVDGYRLAQLDVDRDLRAAIFAAAQRGLARYVEQPDLAAPAQYRLAFRELGLAIGLSAGEHAAAAGFARFLHVRDAIISYWVDPAHRRSATYEDHQDINDVMLATALAPDAFLTLRSPP